MKKHYLMRSLRTCIALCTALIIAITSFGQSVKNTEQIENTVTTITKQISKNLKAQKGMSAADMSAFKNYYEETILWDRGQLFKNIEDDSINSKNTTVYVNLMVARYAMFYDQYMTIPASNRALLSHKTNAVSPPWPGACNPGCSNTDFENGTLSNWMGCYATNNSGSSSGFSYTSTNCTGILGAVTTAAVYPTTGLPQLNITSAASGNDPVVGAALPQLCPLGGNYSCEIGDYNNPNYGVGILEQAFTVTRANCDFTYYYAVVLESPGGSHTHFEQPYFNVYMYDQAGNLIPFCGNYSVTADSASAQGNFKGVYYAADGDSCYYRPWTTVFVPLKKYIGQCVTIKVVASDCALGGHFGYAYFDAKCAPLGIITSAPAICGNPITLTAPAGGASYKWTGPCIKGSSTSQTITVGCAGKYTVIVNSYIGASCADTLDTTIVSATASALANFKSDTVCAGNPTSFTNLSNPLTGSFLWVFGDAGSGSADSSKLTNPTHTYPGPGTYTVKLTITSDSCGADTTFNVVVKAGPVASFTAGPVCLNNPTSFTNTTTGGATAYSWNFGEPLSGPNNTSTLTSPTHTYSTCGKYLVTLIAKSGTCVDTIKDSVTVNPLPTPNFTASPVCLGSTTVLTDGSTINCGGTVTGWAWNFGDPTSGPSNTSTVQDPTHVFSGIGTYSVILTATSNDGCQNSVTLPVTIVPNPSAGFVSGPVCLGSPTVFTDTSHGNPTTWKWNFGDGVGTSTAQNPSYTYTTAGTYTVKLVVSTGAGCIDSTTATVTVNPPPTAGFTATTVCKGTATVFTNTSTGATSYQWSFGDGGTSTAMNPTYTYATAGTYTAKLVAITSSGCKDSTTVTITVNPNPTGTIAVAPVCLGNTSSFSVNPALGAGGTYSWNFGDGVGTSAVQNPTYTYTAANTYNVYVVLTTSSGCFDTVKSTAVVNPNPVANFSTTTVCQGKPTAFTDLSTVKTGTITGWLWNFGDAATSTLQNPTHVYAACGTYNAVLTVTTNAGCTHDTTITVTVNPVPAPNFTATSVCIGFATTFTDASAIGCGGTNNGWSWNFGDGKGTSTSQNPTYTYGAAGTYTVSLTVSSSLGCDSTIKLPVTVYPNPVPAFTETSPCQGSPTQFTDASSGASGWAWNFGDGGTSTMTDPAHLYGAAGRYQVTLVVTSPHGCIDSTKDSITVYPNPMPNFVADTLRGCAPLCVNFKDLSTIINKWGSTITSWSWNFGDSAANSTSSLQNPSHCYTKVGTFTVSLTVTTNNGCTETFVIDNYITTYPTPKANFVASPNPTNMAAPTITFTDLSTGNPVSWSWVTFGDNTDSTKTTQNTQHTYGDTGVYNVTLAIVNKWGCVDTVTLPVDIQPMWTFYVPNAFSPNADGMNDGFIGKGVGIREYEMWIFDRWGMQLYHCTSMSEPWDGRVHTGTSSGQMCQEDTYVWLIEIVDVFHNKHRYIGRVSIVK